MRYSTPRPAYLAFTRDADTATTLFSANGKAAQVKVGMAVALDCGLTTDAETLEQEIHAQFCREPFHVESVRRRLAREHVPPRAAEGCNWRTHRLHREFEGTLTFTVRQGLQRGRH